MALNVRNAETGRFAAALARRAGETQTEAVTKALRQRVGRLRCERGTRRPADELNDITPHCSCLSVLDARTPDEILGYDDRGLPR